MKQFKTSSGQDIPKVINWLANKEHERLGATGKDHKNTDKLFFAFDWDKSNVFDKDSCRIWVKIDEDNFAPFYEVFPTCKNSRGQELPEDIQVEIVEERLRQGVDKYPRSIFRFIWNDSKKGYSYWSDICHETDYSTKSDDTFTQGEIVEVTDYQENTEWQIGEYITDYKSKHVCYHSEAKEWAGWKFIRKIQPLELTIPELLTIAEEVKGTKVKLKS